MKHPGAGKASAPTSSKDYEHSKGKQKKEDFDSHTRVNDTSRSILQRHGNEKNQGQRTLHRNKDVLLTIGLLYANAYRVR